jgi:flagellar hook assembly protein FlgD
LTRNYPNPFNPTTTFQVKVPEATDVKITVYNALGQEVMKLHDGKLAAGIHQFEFKANHLTSGLYFYRITAKDFIAVRRMVLIK